MEKLVWGHVPRLISSFSNSLPSTANEKLIKAVVVAGLYPKVAMIRPSHSRKRPGWVRHFAGHNTEVRNHSHWPPDRKKSPRTAASRQTSPVNVLEGFCDNYPRLCRDRVGKQHFFSWRPMGSWKNWPEAAVTGKRLWPVCKTRTKPRDRHSLLVCFSDSFRPSCTVKLPGSLPFA